MGVFCNRLKFGSTATLNYQTVQNKGRYRKKELLLLLFLLVTSLKSTFGSVCPIQQRKVLQINWQKHFSIYISFAISTFHIIEKLLPHTPFSSLASGGERGKNSGKMAGFPQWAYWPFCSLFSCSALTAIRNFFTKLFKTNWNFSWRAFWCTVKSRKEARLD